jgi:hypothetical protein
MSWTRKRLPEHVVHEIGQSREDYASTAPQDETAMQKRLAVVLSLRNGYFDVHNYAYGNNVPKCLELLDKVAPSASPLVRKVKIDMRVLEQLEGRPPQGISDMLATSTRMTSIEFDGGGQNSKIFHNLFTVLAGLAQNRSGNLTRLKLFSFRESPFESRSPQDRLDLAQSLQGLVSLRELELTFCCDVVVDFICQGLLSCSGLQKVTIVHPNPGSAPPFALKLLKSLHHLTYLNIEASWMANIDEDLQEMTSNVKQLELSSFDANDSSACASMVRAIRRFHRLQSCHVQIRGSFSFDHNRTEFISALSSLPFLESLELESQNRRAFDNETFLHFPRLRQVRSMLLSHELEAIRTLMGPDYAADSFQEIVGVTRIEFIGVLKVLETNTKVKECGLTWPSLFVSLPQDIVDQFHQTLATNTCLKKLQIKFEPKILTVIIQLLQSKQCALEDLRIDGVAMDEHAATLLQCLRSNTTLRRLHILYKVRNAEAFQNLLNALLGLIRDNTHLEELFLGPLVVNPSKSTPFDIDDFAEALSQNYSLKKVQFRPSAIDQPRIDFVCRLFCQRNHLQEMIKKGEMKDALLPTVLESLQPDPAAMFLALRSFPWTQKNESDCLNVM